MADINRDIDILKGTLEGSGPYQQWRHIYPRTTENVLKLLNVVDVKDKDVYAVLSSSDIPFSLIDKRVSSIETFDVNPLTLRYYYLRKWLLENGVLDGKDISYGDAHDIINKGRSFINKDEEQSVIFWNYYISRLKMEFFNLYNATLFEYVSERIPCCYDDDLEYLIEYLNNVLLVFDEMDMGNPDEKIRNRKYDLVYLSNIMDLNDSSRIKAIRDYVETILKPDGQVICTNLVNHPYFDFFRGQRQVFEEKFIYDELFRERVGSMDNVYYRYIKK